MGSFSIWHWLIVGAIILLLFGRGRISEMMGDLGKGITSFKRGLKDDDEDERARAEPPRIASAPAPASDPVVESAREDRTS